MIREGFDAAVRHEVDNPSGRSGTRWIGGELELAGRRAWRWRSRAASARRHHLSRRASRRRPLRRRPPASSTALPSATPSPTQITGLPFAGTLAYKRNVVEGPHLLFTMPASGGDGMQLVEGDAEQARWSADGARLSVVGESPQGLIFVGFVDRDGSNFERLDSPDPTLQLGCGAWSRDEATFACDGWDEQKKGRDGLYTVAADGSGLTRVTTAPEGAHDAPCDFSPDGKQIAFVRTNPADEDRNELMIVNRDGTGERKLIDDAVMLRCRWSPDGVDVPGGGERRHPRSGHDRVPPDRHAAASPSALWCQILLSRLVGRRQARRVFHGAPRSAVRHLGRKRRRKRRHPGDEHARHRRRGRIVGPVRRQR